MSALVKKAFLGNVPAQKDLRGGFLQFKYSYGRIFRSEECPVQAILSSKTKESKFLDAAFASNQSDDI